MHKLTGGIRHFRSPPPYNPSLAHIPNHQTCAGGVAVSTLRRLAGGFEDDSSPALEQRQPPGQPPPGSLSGQGPRPESPLPGGAPQIAVFSQGLRGDRAGWAGIVSGVQFALRPVLKAAAAAVTLGTGASLGPEGPSVEIGTVAARVLGRVLRSKRNHYVSLIAAGSGAGAPPIDGSGYRAYLTLLLRRQNLASLNPVFT